MSKYRSVILIIFVIIVFCSQLFAVEYEVGPEDDMDAVISRLKAGDVLNVAEGIYANGWTISGIKGTKDNPIIIRGSFSLREIDTQQPNNATTQQPLSIIRPQNNRDGILFYGNGGSEYVIIENLKIEGASRAGIVINGSSNITIRDCVLANNGFWGIQTCLSDGISVEDCEIYGSQKEHGIYLSTTDHPLVRRCRIYSNHFCGIQMNGDENEGGDGMISGGLIEENLIYQNGVNGGAAINMDGVEKTTVRDNMISNNYCGGMVSFNDCGAHAGSNNQFLDNIVYFQDKKGRFGLRLIDGSKNAKVKGNVLICGKGPALEIDKKSISGLKSDNNIFFVHGNEKPIKLGWKRLSLEQWQNKTKQDENSSVL